MTRRAPLPGANELFRATPDAAQGPANGTDQGSVAKTPPSARHVGRGESTGRERHDEKITVYLSADELVQLDEAKSALYRDLGLKVDRGRIVREAVAVVIGDLAAKGEASILARRLRER